MDLDVILISFNREKAIERTLGRLREAGSRIARIIVVDNASTDGTRAVVERFAKDIPNLELIKSATNLGVAGGRNMGIRASTAEILVFLDDDAEFTSPDFPEKVLRRFSEDESLGAAAFKIINGHTSTMRANEFPHRSKRKSGTNEEMEVSYFVGAGHAIRRSALEAAGPYPEEFFYSQEELFLSYRIIKAGFRIIYMPGVEVIHWQSPTGRVVNQRKWSLLLRNTLLVNFAFLPWIFFLASLPIWTAKILVRSGSPRAALTGLSEFRRMQVGRTVRREAISFRTLLAIWRNGGRVLW